MKAYAIQQVLGVYSGLELDATQVVNPDRNARVEISVGPVPVWIKFGGSGVTIAAAAEDGCILIPADATRIYWMQNNTHIALRGNATGALASVATTDAS